MTANKTISRVTDPKKQQAETDRYWRGLSIGKRFSAVWDVSEAAYAFAAAFNGNPTNDAHRSERSITRLIRNKLASGREQDILDVKKLQAEEEL